MSMSDRIRVAIKRLFCLKTSPLLEHFCEDANINFKGTDKELFACNELSEVNNMVCFVNMPSREQSPKVRNEGLDGELP